MTWTDDAACRGMDTAVFFPVSDESRRPSRYRVEAAQALAVCSECRAQAECAADAAEVGASLDGIWSGTTPRDRLRVRAGDRLGAPGRTRTPINHGTDAGYQAHARRGELPCDACRTAHTTSNAAYSRTEGRPRTDHRRSCAS